MATTRTTLEPGVPAAHTPPNGKGMLALCAVAEITEIRIQFDGSGDSGQVDDVLVVVRGKTDPVDITEVMPDFRRQFQDFGYEILEKFCPGDWVNNEGGFGEIVITIGETPEFKLEYNQRIETSEYSETLVDMEEALPLLGETK